MIFKSGKFKMISMFFSISICFASAFLLTGCQRNAEAFTRTDFCYDTVISLTIYDTADNADSVNALLDEAITLCREYDLLFTRTGESGDIYRINHAGGEWTNVSDETIRLLQSALQYCEMTNGQIDITIAPVKDLWDFTGDPDARPASTTDTEAALAHVDYRLVEINGNNVRLADPDAGIDVGFIAKGYIADQVRALLLEKGVTSALINLGGNIAVIGEKPEGAAFQIGIQEPFATAGSYMYTVECSDTKNNYSSVVTSGTYERSFTYNGKLYHHILDCSTGKPVETDLTGVTILTDSSLHADALSTTCILLGYEKAKSYIESLEDVEAVLIRADGELYDTRD